MGSGVRVRGWIGRGGCREWTSMLLSWWSVSARQSGVKSTFMYRLSSHTWVRARVRVRVRARVKG